MNDSVPESFKTTDALIIALISSSWRVRFLTVARSMLRRKATSNENQIYITIGAAGLRINSTNQPHFFVNPGPH